MPLFSYRCEGCGLEIENLVFGPAPKGVTCPECFDVAHRIYKPLAIIKICDGNKKTISISTREWQTDQDTKARRGKEDVKNKLKRAKKKIMNTSGIFSESRLRSKREEIMEARHAT